MKLKLVLADDHPLVLEGLRALLASEGEFDVAGLTSDGAEVVALVREVRPDVVVLDLAMPGTGGLDVIRELAHRSPGTRVVVLSMHANEAYVLEALSSGAAAYVLKQSEAGALVQAIREVAAGRRYLSPPLSERAVEAYARRAEDVPSDPYMTLTQREREVLRLVAAGRTSPEIAELLFISPRTVESHRARLMKKLGMRTQAEIIRWALERGILPPEP